MLSERAVCVFPEKPLCHEPWLVSTALDSNGVFPSVTSPQKNYITPSIFRNTGPGLFCRWVWHWSFQPLWLQKAKNLHGAGHGSRRRRRRVRTEHLWGTGSVFLCCSMCPSGTEDALSCLHSFFWPAFDPRRICIINTWVIPLGGEGRRGKEKSGFINCGIAAGLGQKSFFSLPVQV